MKIVKSLVAINLVLTFLTVPIVGFAADSKGEGKADGKDKPYPLETCVVSGEKLGDMGKPYTFTHEGQEVKLCCKSCLKDFKKEPAKYVKKIKDAEKAKKS